MWKTFPRRNGRTYTRWENEQGELEEYTDRIITLDEFDNGQTHYIAIYYDEGIEAYKRTPIFTFEEPDNQGGIIAIPKDGSYKIGEIQKSQYPIEHSHAGEPCWKTRIKITGGQRTYANSRGTVYTFARFRLLENSLYYQTTATSGTRYRLNANDKETNAEYAIFNGEILIPEE